MCAGAPPGLTEPAVPPSRPPLPPLPPPTPPMPPPPEYILFDAPTPLAFAQHTGTNVTEHDPLLPASVYLSLLESFAPQNNCPASEVQLRVLGPSVLTVQPGMGFIPPAAYCTGGTHEIVGLDTLQTALSGTDFPSLRPLTSDNTYGPWVLEYTATGVNGSVGPIERVSVFISIACNAGETWCFEAGRCMVDAQCALHLAVASDDADLLVPYVPAIDTIAPQLRVFLFPDDQVLSLGLQVPVVIETWAIATGTKSAQYLDPGWVAFDDSLEVTDLTNNVSTFGLAAVMAAVELGEPTALDSPLPIRYFVQDASGNSAEVMRVVHVVCAPMDTVCELPSGAMRCSNMGSCVVLEEDAHWDSIEAAELELLGPAIVFVPQGQPYSSCSKEHPVDFPCDQVQCYRPCAFSPTQCDNPSSLEILSMCKRFLSPVGSVRLL